MTVNHCDDPGNDFKVWFPRPINPAPRETRLRVFCFHGAGMDQSVWTGTGTTLSPMPNPFIKFAATEGVQFLAVQLPNRGQRRKEEHPRTIENTAALLFKTIRFMVEDSTIPYVLLGYSMGAWIAFELCRIISREHLPLPIRLIAVAMISPDIHFKNRPWPATTHLDDHEFQMQLRKWNCNEILFEEDMWAAYGQLLRNDHEMLDTYFVTDGITHGEVPCTIVRGKDDAQLQNPSLFTSWAPLLGNPLNKEYATTSEAKMIIVDGNHGLLFDAVLREKFFHCVTGELDRILLALDYGQ